MNITELDSYNLDDAVKFNDHLNPRLWDDREHLRPEVRERLLEIADDFREFLGVTDLAIQDITISGSNAAYTYTPNSDIDLHLVVNMPNDPVYRELFDAKKFQYNEQHDITIGGADVELYVQNADQPHISQGVYSIVNNEWLQVPRRVKSVVDDTSTRDKFEKVGRQIERAIRSGNLKRMTKLAEKIKRMRQTGLEAHGEFGPENLAFKMLRSQGLIKQLYDARNAAKDKEFSLAEKTAKPRVTYGFRTPTVVEADPVGLEEEPVSLTDEEILKDFIDFCFKELKLKSMPVVKLRKDPEWSVRNKTFGRYIDDHNLLEVAWGQRHIMDVLRTVAHELTHRHQHERESVPTDAGETGSPYENEANARAGILMRDYARLHPEYFAVGQAENLHADEVKESVAENNSQCRVILTLHDDSAAPDETATRKIAINVSANNKQSAIKLAKQKLIKSPQYDGSRIVDAQVKTSQLNELSLGSGLPAEPVASGKSDEAMWTVRTQANEYLVKFSFDPEPQEDEYDDYDDFERAYYNAGMNTAFFARDKNGQWTMDITNVGEKELTQIIATVARLLAEFLKQHKHLKYIGIGGKDRRRDQIYQRLIQQNLQKYFPGQDFAIVPGGINRVVSENDNGQRQLLDFDSLYGKAFKITDHSGNPNTPGFSIVTPLNGASWNWRERPEFKAIVKRKLNDPGWLGDHKYQQIVDFMAGNKFDPAKHLVKDVKEGASGYIPTKKQAKDPRFSMALTQDIRPGQLGKEANKLKLKTNRQGIPQVANPNGLFEKLALELSQFKKTTVAESVEQLDEVNMSPSTLMKWATSKEAQGIRAGFEAELIFRDTTNNGDSDYEMEPDYDQDERCRSISQIIDFFNDGEYGGLSSRQESNLQNGLDEQYMEWYDEQMQKDFSNEAEDLIRKVMVDEGDWDLDNEIQKQLALLDLSDDEINDIVNAGERAPKFNSSKEQILYAEANPLYEKYLTAQEEAEDLLNELVDDEVRKQGANWDAALDDFRDNYQIDDDSGFFDDVGLRWMSDVASEYNLDWPYMTGGGGNDGGRDWDSIGDSLNGVVGMPVKVSSNYHSTTRREGQWIVEPDSSLSADDREDMGLEIVSPPMPLLMALEKLQAVTDWANDPSEGNAYTNDSTGLHMGVSVPYKGGDVDYLKLILFLGDEYVLQQFGREANTYTKSAMKGFRENLKSGRADPAGALKLMQHGLLELAQKEIQKGVGQGKYTSAHIQDGYIEFRSAGGDWLAEESADPEKLTSTMLRYARAMQIAADPSADRREYAKKLYKLIAPEGDSQLALFSQFAAGELNKEQLKKLWAEKTIGNERKINQYFKLYQKVNGVWTAVPGAEYRGMQEDEVKNRVWMKYGREALDSGEYQLVNMSDNQEWEVYDVKTGATLEIVQGANRGAAADKVFDKYANQGIGFNVRPYVDPKTLTPRAKLAKRIVEPKQKSDWEVVYKPTGRVIDNILRVDRDEAQRLLSKVAVLHDFENTDDLEIRPQTAERPQSADDKQDSRDLQARLTGSVPSTSQDNDQGDWEFYRTETGNVIDTVNGASRAQAEAVRQDIVRRYGHPNASVGMRPVGQIPEVPVDVAQNFGNQFSGQWRVVDGAGRELYVFRGVGNSQADANRIAATWARENNYSGALDVLPVMIENVAENFADGKGPGRPGDSQRHGIPKGATMAQLEKASHASGRKGQLARWQLNMRRGKAKAK